MNSEEIAVLCESLYINDKEEPTALLAENLQVVGEKKLALSLVGKFISSKSINREAFHLNVGWIWRLSDDCEVEVVRNNVFTFHFKKAIDKKRVLMGDPWSFDNSLLVLKEPHNLGIMESMQFTKAAF
ncbi:hypothetical protein ACOSP7_018410 [Xanthoceras sorbifolium]